MDLLDVSSDTASKTKHFATNFTGMLLDLGQIKVSFFDVFIQINLQIKGLATMCASLISLVFVDPNAMFSKVTL